MALASSLWSWAGRVRVRIEWTGVPDGHKTRAAAIATGHRRALSVLAEPMVKADLALRQNVIARTFLERGRRRFAPGCQPIWVADRGFGRVAGCAAADA
ncbi:MAG: hypothetical protein K6U14_01670 [Firmicutes bacterium]|nr:hypothetical protein [Alicyclobacillaceae bacterium]MCL6496327.1 hypothetical protein [Bacillota bacterium]